MSVRCAGPLRHNALRASLTQDDEATEAIRELQSHPFRINGQVEISGSCVKGLAFEARPLAAQNFNNAVWRG